MGARWYDPGTGAFDSRDTYTYASGDVDPGQPLHLRRGRPDGLHRPGRPLAELRLVQEGLEQGQEEQVRPRGYKGARPS